MRSILVAAAILVTGGALAPACALEASDTMRSWRDATAKERADLLEALLGKAAISAKVSQCMNDTSKTPGHAELSIGDVAKVCAMPGNADQPV